MSAIRLPLLCAFAGGCLSSAVLIGLWTADAANGLPAPKQHADNGEFVATKRTKPRDEGLVHASLVAQGEPARVITPNRGQDANGEGSASKDAQEPVSSAPTPPGSAVSDILTDLEAAYRQRLIAAARAEAADATEAAPERPTTRAAMAQVERPVATDPSPVIAARAPAAVAPAAPAAVAPAAPAAVVPAAVVPPPVAAVAPPPVAAAPAVVAQNDVRAPDVHYGDINQNTYNITNIRQGDVYVMQQQLAMLQYMQLLGMSSAVGRVAPGYGVRPAAPQTQQFRQFPSTLTNPDNPWGFNFAPPNLVH